MSGDAFPEVFVAISDKELLLGYAYVGATGLPWAKVEIENDGSTTDATDG